MIAAVRTFVFYLLFLPGTLLLLLLAMLLSGSAGALRFLSAFWAGWFLHLARLVLGIRLRVLGEVPQQPAIVAFKHQSYYEPILTLYFFRNPAVVMKEELRHIPLWGRLAARHGALFVAREKHGSALRALLRQARQRADAGRPIVIFPEGTRVAVGKAPPVKPGLYALYAGLHLPVVPVALDAGRCWPRRFAKERGTVHIDFRPAIEPGLPRAEFEARVGTELNRTSWAEPGSGPGSEAAP